MQRNAVAKSRMNVRFLTRVAVLGVSGFLLMMFDTPLPIFPAFLQIDLGDLPALIGAFAFGPLAGMAIEFVKCLLYFILGFSTTGGVGDLSNFVIGSVFTMTAGFIYSSHKSKKTALLSCIAATLAMTVVGVLSNYFIMIPFFSRVFPLETIIGMGTAITPLIKDKLTLVMYGVTPFNLFKGALLSSIAVLTYKHISPVLKRGIK